MCVGLHFCVCCRWSIIRQILDHNTKKATHHFVIIIIFFFSKKFEQRCVL